MSRASPSSTPADSYLYISTLHDYIYQIPIPFLCFTAELLLVTFRKRLILASYLTRRRLEGQSPRLSSAEVLDYWECVAEAHPARKQQRRARWPRFQPCYNMSQPHHPADQEKLSSE